MFFFYMIQTKQGGFGLENSQLCQTEHVGKMFAYIHVLHNLSHHIPYNKHHAPIQKIFQGGEGGRRLFEFARGSRHIFANFIM